MKSQEECGGMVTGVAAKSAQWHPKCKPEAKIPYDSLNKLQEHNFRNETTALQYGK